MAKEILQLLIRHKMMISKSYLPLRRTACYRQTIETGLRCGGRWYLIAGEPNIRQ